MVRKNKFYERYVEWLPSLEGKVVAITGCTTGTGYWAAHACITKGVSVLLLLNRESSRSVAAEESLKAYAAENGPRDIIQAGSKNSDNGPRDIIQAKSDNGPREIILGKSDNGPRDIIQAKSANGPREIILGVTCDLMNFESVRKAAAEVEKIANEHGGLDVLLNNAGIMMFPDDRTVDEFDVQMQTNHLSHFLLTKLLLPSLQQAADSRGEARVVQHSSGARDITSGLKSKTGNLEAEFFEKSYSGTLGGNGVGAAIVRYHMTKLANSVFGIELHDRLQAKGITKVKSIIAEPGIADTALGDNLVKANKGASCCSSVGCALACLPLFNLCFVPMVFQSAPDGACPLLAAGFAPDAESGDFYIPENKTKGPPKKVISAGAVVVRGTEKLTMNKENRDMLWTKSEEAIGEKFLE